MASYRALAAVSRSLQALLADRMTMDATVTLAPPDVTLANISGARVNLYLIHVLENAALRNQTAPTIGHPGSYGRPPLALTLRYLLSTHSAIETQESGDLNAQLLLGDAMRVLHDHGGSLGGLRMKKAVAGRIVGDPVLDPEVGIDPDLVRVTLVPAPLDELTRFWSSLGEAAFRRSVLYDAEVVRIETIEPQVSPRPVEERRITLGTRAPPVLIDAMRAPGPAQPPGERRVAVGDKIAVTIAAAPAGRLWVRLGDLDLIGIIATPSGIVELEVPDVALPPDSDHAAPRPIDGKARLRPGVLAVQVVAEVTGEGVAGGIGASEQITTPRLLRSNLLLLQLVPSVSGIAPPTGDADALLTVTGTRLWHPGARTVVVIGGAAVPVRAPGPNDGWAAPTATSVQVPVADAAPLLAGPGLFPVVVEVDGMRSRDAGLTFELAA